MIIFENEHLNQSGEVDLIDLDNDLKEVLDRQLFDEEEPEEEPKPKKSKKKTTSVAKKALEKKEVVSKKTKKKKEEQASNADNQNNQTIFQSQRSTSLFEQFKLGELSSKNLLNNSLNEQSSLDNEKTGFFCLNNEMFPIQFMEDIPAEENVFNGVLFIGDPHFWSKKPNRRKDDDFAGIVLDKLSQSIEYANQNNLLILCLGDLFHWGNEKNVGAVNRLVKVLKKANSFYCLYGNHDINEAELTENTMLDLLDSTGVISVIKQNGFFLKAQFSNHKGQIKTVLFGATPYGKTIPDNVLGFVDEKYENQLLNLDVELSEREDKIGRSKKIISTFSKEAVQDLEKFKKDNNLDEIIWLTHHNLAFVEFGNLKFPPLKNILGVDKVFNGHLHKTLPPVIVEDKRETAKTVYYNQGNIARLTIDTVKHQPAVWSYSPFEEEVMKAEDKKPAPLIRPFFLKVKPFQDIFYLLDKHLDEDLSWSFSEEDAERFIQEEKEGNENFAQLLKQQENLAKKTDEAVLIKESLNSFFENEREKLSEEVVKTLMRYCHSAIEQEITN